MHESKLNREATADYIGSFSTKILDDFYAKNQGISGQEIVNLTTIKQVNFFILKVLFDQWQEETKKFKSPFFNYKNESVSGALKNLINVLSKNILIERDALEPLLKEAVESTLILMYQPGDYLNTMIQSITKIDKIKELTTASKYIKLHKGLFEEIIAAIQKSAHAETEYAPIIESIIKDHAFDSAEIESVAQLFSAVEPMDILEKGEDLALPTSEADDNEMEDFMPLDESASTSKYDDQFEPLEASPSDKEVENVSSESVNEQYSEEVETIHNQYQEQTETVASKHETNQTMDFEASISINQRYMFVNDLFGNDVPEYEMAIAEIEGQESFDDAVELLVQSYSRKYDWDMNSDEVKELLKVIFKRFR